MILYQNGLIKLEYNPATDILFVRWPDIQSLVLAEVKQALRILVENVRNYDIKNLLIDARNTSLEIDSLEYKEVLRQFAADLRSTRLRKMARITTVNQNREKPIRELVEQDQLPLNFQLKHFADLASATEWLKASK